ncbi:flagellar basal body rod protein FlgC [Lutibaculum baratangense]|uniref:Flagellar basal-body rod protein FlgC n=1 Tax=Lutibaculum baratangense AMV1 TaxID=631454 RepID=V4R4A3_9HYPH|nr:flagellar basal body rod protein FlgC [Lutibaculum baratangense]ESR26787.1 Flagellar basal-body rod protein FlgC [Lutibaculum baratangense AMV1]
MELMKSLHVAASGLRAQSARMRIIAENIANADSTAKTPDGDPYRRQVPNFRAEFDRKLGATVVEQAKTLPDRSDFKLRYAPSHPSADEKGYVKMPNVETLIEAMDMRQAQRSYEANLGIIETARNMVNRTLDILRA